MVWGWGSADDLANEIHLSCCNHVAYLTFSEHVHCGFVPLLTASMKELFKLVSVSEGLAQGQRLTSPQEYACGG